MERLATLVPLKADDVAGLVDFARRERIDLVVVGPEAPLVAGLVDRLSEAGILAFGPTAAAAEIEGSKAFAKEVMVAAGIPTAAYATFTAPGPALAWAEALGGQVVVKADGLAAGKGVVVCGGMEEVRAALQEILVDRVHGAAGATVLLEEKLTGPEASCICITDGKRVRMLPPAQDHKRIFDGDRGPNTGGMGAFCPTPKVTSEALAEIQRTVLVPAVRELDRRGRTFRGALYAGLMLTPKGPRVLEFNARLGDPETQPILMRVKGDLVPLLVGSARGDLGELPLELDGRASVGVVLAGEGYPGKVTTGDVIEGAEAEFPEGVQVFHAATRRDASGRLLSAGGRVLTVCALGAGLDDAARRAYAAVARVGFRGMQFRKDIGGNA
jgi:phosphoribosylamine--glycine ligase